MVWGILLACGESQIVRGVRVFHCGWREAVSGAAVWCLPAARVEAVVDAIRVERSVEVAMGFGNWGVCAEARCAQHEGQFAGGLVGGINSVTFIAWAPRFGQVMVDGGELSCG